MSREKLDTRSHILETALATLEKKGGKGVRMADIAKLAGVSRQAVYLHFSSRAELLNAATKYLDELLDVDARLMPSRLAKTGTKRLALYIECWGNYIPNIYGVAKALIMDLETDEAAATAWNDRMAAMRHGCQAIIDALQDDGKLQPHWTSDAATDMLWTLLSIQNWESLTMTCNWSTEEYIQHLQQVTARMLIIQ
jgi:AcrR family transcriptional regulator